MNINLLTVIGVAVMLLLAICIILFVVMYQRRVIAHQVELEYINTQKELELLKASIKGEEDERLRIATELHDDVGATLSSVCMVLAKETNGEYDERTITRCKDLLKDCLVKVRNISHKLQPASLKQFGLETSLQMLVDVFRNTKGVTAFYHSHMTLPRFNDNIELAAYRISQELINNMMKHSGVSNIRIETNLTTDGLQIVYAHDGTGLTQELFEEMLFKKGAIGLKNIINRVKSVNASIRFYKEQDKVYKTELVIPMNKGDIKITTGLI